MRHSIVLAALLPLAGPALAGTQASGAADGIDRATKVLADPARQDALAKSLGVMAEVLLDLPLAPLMAPLAQATGKDAQAIDPDMTLRKLAPGASGLPRQIETRLPGAMDSMAGMSEALAAMLPRLEAMADQLREALPPETR